MREVHKTGQDRRTSRQTLMISFILDRVLGFPVLVLTLRAIAFIYSTVYRGQESERILRYVK